MNKKRREGLRKAFDELNAFLYEEREAIDNQEESFGETGRWQEAEGILSDAESAIADLEDALERWDA